MDCSASWRTRGAAWAVLDVDGDPIVAGGLVCGEQHIIPAGGAGAGRQSGSASEGARQKVHDRGEGQPAGLPKRSLLLRCKAACSLCRRAACASLHPQPRTVRLEETPGAPPAAHLWPELTSMQPLNLEAAMGSTGTASAATMVTSCPSKHTVCGAAGRRVRARMFQGAHGAHRCAGAHRKRTYLATTGGRARAATHLVGESCRVDDTQQVGLARLHSHVLVRAPCRARQGGGRGVLSAGMPASQAPAAARQTCRKLPRSNQDKQPPSQAQQRYRATKPAGPPHPGSRRWPRAAGRSGRGRPSSLQPGCCSSPGPCCRRAPGHSPGSSPGC